MKRIFIVFWFYRIEAGDWLLRGRIQGSVLFRQYYPEGGWGYIVLFSFIIVTILSQVVLLIVLVSFLNF